MRSSHYSVPSAPAAGCGSRHTAPCPLDNCSWPQQQACRPNEIPSYADGGVDCMSMRKQWQRDTSDFPSLALKHVSLHSSSSGRALGRRLLDTSPADNYYFACWSMKEQNPRAVPSEDKNTKAHSSIIFPWWLTSVQSLAGATSR